jgi:argininosuccinate lyase
MPAATSFVRHQWRKVCIYTQHHLGEAIMANAHRASAAPVEELPADLIRLVTAVHALPDQYSRELIPSLERVIESTKRRRRILSLVQDALSQLRLDMKYLMFDVEATRRERDEYHARLHENESDL